jgi:hypothetical protein
MIIVGFGMLCIITLVALMFVFRGEKLLDRIPTIKKFRGIRQDWGSLVIKNTLPISNPSTRDLGQLRFGEISDLGTSGNEAIFEEVEHKRVGDLIAVVYYKERDLRHFVQEMRVYSGFFLLLLLFGVLTNADKFIGKSLKEISEAVFSYHVTPLLEVFMIIYLSLRLFVEIQSVRSLLEGE